ncbi:12287_t:CDS:2 [Rhizophagus irregularis]|nr:12287_t:CDS:2 [Rhizophagus irregularis]
MQNTDRLGRQDHESFHTIRIHEWPPYPSSRQDVSAYIAHIRRIVSRLPNRWYCTYCKSFIDRGWGDDSSMDQAVQLHLYSCPKHFKFDYYTHHAEMIQKAFRRYIKRRNNRVARIIQKVAIPWLYRPGFPLIQKAERHFYHLAVFQM